VDFASYAQRAVDLVNTDLTHLSDLASHLERRPWLAEQVVEGDLAPLRTVQAELGILVDASAAGAESVKPGETRGVYALCVASWRGSLIQAMVGSLGGWGRRVNRVGLAA